MFSDKEMLEWLIYSSAHIAVFKGLNGHKYWLEWSEECERQCRVFDSPYDAIQDQMRVELKAETK